MAEHRYLEITETLSDMEQFEKQPTILRIEVNNEDQAKGEYAKYKSLFAGMKLLSQYHQHFHSPNESLPCKKTIIDEVV